jgi:hypothetical protein
MKDLIDTPFIQWLINILAIMAGIAIVKTLMGFLPDSQITDPVKKVFFMV